MASSTREKILAVSLRLFNEQGYRNVTMRAIADALSISVGNLTYHFAKKQDIVAALMDDVFAQMTATADMPAASLAQIDSLFSMMLDTLERCAFFFLDNELKQENDEAYNKANSSRDLEEIKKIAIQEYGMQYADQGQIVTYSDEGGNDYVRQNADIPDASGK